MKLIVIEGLDGSGKSTQQHKLREFFNKSDIEHEYLHFPRTEAPFFGELISRFLRGEFGMINEVDPYIVAMLYAGDRKDAADKISGWLKKGKYVLLDRYVYSNIAYQCAKLKDKQERQSLKNWIIELEYKHFGIPVPDINIFLDVPPLFTESKLNNGRDGSDRSYLNGSTDIHESDLDFQESVREVYFESASTDPNLEIIDCSGDNKSIQSPDKIFENIIELLIKNKII